MSLRNRLLLVEDDESFGYILSKYLEMNDFQAKWVKSGTEASLAIKEEQFDLGILDIMLPEKDGFTLAKEWTAQQGNTPFIFLTAKLLKVDKLQGYKLGCLDFIVKPIEEEVFIAKINAIIGKSENNSKTIHQIGDYEFDPNNQILRSKSQTIALTQRESQILYILSDSKNQVVDRKKFLKELWGKNDYFNRKSMDVFIFKLRKHLAEDPSIAITNIHGRGFMLETA